jgi:BCD family chlorophyll transporter-like MFS transporter
MGAAAVDVARGFWADGPAFGLVFAAEAALFLAAAVMAARVMENSAQPNAALVPGE